jgi:hypothetical protein
VVQGTASRFPRPAVFDVGDRGCAQNAGQACQSCSLRAGLAAKADLEHDGAIPPLLGTSRRLCLSASLIASARPLIDEFERFERRREPTQTRRCRSRPWTPQLGGLRSFPKRKVPASLSKSRSFSKAWNSLLHPLRGRNRRESLRRLRPRVPVGRAKQPPHGMALDTASPEARTDKSNRC